MNKKILATLVATALSLSPLVTSNAVASDQNTAAVSEITSVSQVTRDLLMTTDRLTQIDSSTVSEQSAEETQALKDALVNAEDGATIMIKDGQFADLGVVNVTASNVTIKAENPGKAWLTGLVQLELNGDDIMVDGLVFTKGGPAERFGGVRMMGDRITLQNSTFYYFNHDYTYEPDEERSEYPKYLWLSLWGKDGKVVNNRFEGKQKRGTLIGVQKDDSPDNHLIANNIFLDQLPNQFNEFAIEEAIRYNGNSWEAIRIGDSKSSQWPSNSQFVDNLLINMSGERELISIKSGGNNIAGNTIFESSSLISLRHGKANTVDSNVILGNEKLLTGGIRIYDEDHVISNNYIANTRGRDGVIEGNADLRGGVVINTGIIDVADNEKLDEAVKGKELNKQWTPKNIRIENNSLVDTEWGIVYGNQTHRVSLFDNSEVETVFSGVNISFKGNVVDNSEHTDYVSVRAVKELPLVNPSYENEHYVGTVTSAEQISSYSAELPQMKQDHGFNSYQNAGADVSKLRVITAETAGPSYELLNMQK